MPEPSYAHVSSDSELALPAFWFSHCFSTAQSCPILCDPMDCSSPGSCPPLSPGVCSNSYPLNWWCHPSISSFVMPFSPFLQSFLASGSFSKSWLFTSRGQSGGPSASASVLSMNTQGWFSLVCTGLLSLLSKRLSRVFSSTVVRKHQFFGAQIFYGSILTSIRDYWKNHGFN